MYFIITVDTEGDNQWADPAPMTTENIRFIPRFQALCDRFEFKPTYLCSYEMIKAPLLHETIAPYMTSNRAEIGAHLHPWSTPPFEFFEKRAAGYKFFPHELPINLFEKKLSALTEAITEKFGQRPTSYRAGRYGFCEPHIDFLLKFGYMVDCSVVPYTSYKNIIGIPGGKGGADFRNARPGAYYLSKYDCTQSGNSDLLEVPITVLFPKWPFSSYQRMQQWWLDHAGGLSTRVLNKCGFGPRWCRPGRCITGKDLVAVFRTAQLLNLPCVEMMLHSSELMPGCSPVFPDASSIELLYITLEKLFFCIADSGGHGVTLTEFSHYYKQQLNTDVCL
jgi:hypothetical protein